MPENQYPSRRDWLRKLGRSTRTQHPDATPADLSAQATPDALPEQPASGMSRRGFLATTGAAIAATTALPPIPLIHAVTAAPPIAATAASELAGMSMGQLVLKVITAKDYSVYNSYICYRNAASSEDCIFHSEEAETARTYVTALAEIRKRIALLPPDSDITASMFEGLSEKEAKPLHWMLRKETTILTPSTLAAAFDSVGGQMSAGNEELVISSVRNPYSRQGLEEVLRSYNYTMLCDPNAPVEDYIKRYIYSNLLGSLIRYELPDMPETTQSNSILSWVDPAHPTQAHFRLPDNTHPYARQAIEEFFEWGREKFGFELTIEGGSITFNHVPTSSLQSFANIVAAQNQEYDNCFHEISNSLYPNAIYHRHVTDNLPDCSFTNEKLTISRSAPQQSTQFDKITNSLRIANRFGKLDITFAPEQIVFNNPPALLIKKLQTARDIFAERFREIQETEILDKIEMQDASLFAHWEAHLTRHVLAGSLHEISPETAIEGKTYPRDFMHGEKDFRAQLENERAKAESAPQQELG